MWLVELSLKRPYTVAVMCFLLILSGSLSLSRMAVDIFPAIDLPVVAVIWTYSGLSPEDMERRVVLPTERGMSTTVNGIERIESQSISGIGLLKVYFNPDADVGTGIAQISTVASSLLRAMPPGILPPNIIQFNASNVAVAQLTLSSERMPEQKIVDYAANFIRIRLFTIPGISMPAPFGGKFRQINVDLDPVALAGRGLAPADVVNALSAGNVIVPAGTARMGNKEFVVTLNSSPSSVDAFSAIPVRVVNGIPIALGDVAHISDSFADQNNIVRVNGRRAANLAVLKHSDASTLAVVEATKEALPAIRAAAPEGLDIRLDFDQSIFVRGAITNVLREALLASALVSLMIGFFLGNWRSMVIVSTSIPLAIIAALTGLKLAGHTINIMTLGGLALAVGLLVDDATVEVENIHRNRALGKPLTVAILDGARQIAVPAIVATLSICVVFFPVVLLYGPARFLFTPLALAVVLAMLASYLLSRTLVPLLARLLMAKEAHRQEVGGGGGGGGGGEAEAPAHPGVARLATFPAESSGLLARWASRVGRARDAGLGRFEAGYGRLLELVLAHRTFVLWLAILGTGLSSGLTFVVGRDFFPSVDTGLMKLHFRAPPGTRLERTEEMVAEVEDAIRETIPSGELATINSMVGMPNGYNLAFVPSDNVAATDADLLVALRQGHRPSRDYVQRLRRLLVNRFPGATIYFQPADIISQVLSFGVSAPLDVQIEYPNLDVAADMAARVSKELRKIPGIEDVHTVQVLDAPTLRFDVDRQRAAQLGLGQRDVAGNMLVALSSSGILSPSFFLNPANNVNYNVVVKAPIEQTDTVDRLRATPILPATSALASTLGQDSLTARPEAPAPTLGSLSTVRALVSPHQITHSTVQRVMDVAASVEGRDLGAVSSEVEAVLAGLGTLPPGMRLRVRGQSEVMNQSFRSLGLGLLVAVALVYALMVVLFQSWLDPFLIMLAVPGALVGILWVLALTGTTLNVESFMGAIMAVGIAVSNSILLVSFANDLRREDRVTPVQAAWQAGRTRLRPVLMTALAMIIGMTPMALGLGEAGEQNAPLGRAVIGGLLAATGFTLFVVPTAYASLRKALPTKHLLDARFASEKAAGALALGPGDVPA
jgi:multidrug efflux pump subunit AcrB